MFYRLVAVDRSTLPARIHISGDAHEVTDGGLLLEPPTLSPASTAPPDGYCVIKLFGTLRTGTRELLARYAEWYRWTTAGELDISRRESDSATRFVGRRTIDGLELVAAANGSDVLPADMRLEFRAAAADSSISEWRDTFDFGPPQFTPIDPGIRNDPEMLARFREAVLAGEHERRLKALARLEAAWRAPD